MAAIIRSAGVLSSSEEDSHKFHKRSGHKSYVLPRNQESLHQLECHVGSSYNDSPYSVTKESHRLSNSDCSSSNKQGKRRGLVLSSGQVCKEDDKRLALMILLPSQDGECNQQAREGESNALVASLRACTKYKDLRRGSRIHDDIRKLGLVEKCSDALVTMYAKCGALEKAQALLDAYKSLDVISWTSLISGYAREGRGQDALNCFESMRHEGIFPNAVTYLNVLKACGTVRAIEKGKQIHDEIKSKGLLENSVLLGNALVDMYAKCGVLSKAHRVLEELCYRDVVSWNTIIVGYAQQGHGEKALDCYQTMQDDGILPNSVTYACVLKACGVIGARAIDTGTQIHDKIMREGLLKDDVVLGNALVTMYAKCGALAKAHMLLEELPSRDVISWNALTTGYADEGQGEQALDCFKCMKHEGFSPDQVTYACLLKACATLGAANKGKQLHDMIVRQGLLRSNDIVLGSAILDMYAKCGALSKARQVFEELSSRDVVAWTELIAGYAQRGQAEQALNCFECMQREGVLPNAVTFSCILNVCSHLGLVEEGHELFLSMNAKWGVEPNLECYSCMIDLFGRAGHLERAVELIEEMPCSNYSVLWHALMSASHKWGDANVGRWAFKHAVQLDKTDGSAYILMANIYAAESLVDGD